MDQALLIRSVQEWQSFYRDARRDLLPRTTPRLPEPNLAAALVGVRRCGKTSLAILMSRQIPEERVVYYNFEDWLFHQDPDVRFLDPLVSHAAEISAGKPELLILDEIHNVDGWERWVRTAVDQKRYRIVITGSSAKLLSRELATSIAGRCLEYPVWPLSFQEILNFDQVGSRHPNEMVAAVRRMMTWGGFPAVVQLGDNHARQNLLRQYLSDIVLKDVVTRNAIRNPRALQQILAYYLTNVSSLHSYNGLRKAFGIREETADAYTQALKDAFVLFEVRRYHPNMKVQARDPRKVYAIDPGLRNVAARSVNEDTGKLLENTVFVELLRRGKDVSYYKGEQEVDFVVTEGYRPVGAIQVCDSDLSDEKIRKREVEGLAECLNALSLSRGDIITRDREETVSVAGKEIVLTSGWKWLLTT